MTQASLDYVVRLSLKKRRKKKKKSLQSDNAENVLG